MISKEEAEEIASRLVRMIPELLKATVVRTRLFREGEYIRAQRLVLDPDSVVDEEAVGPAYWAVVFEIVTRGDEYLNKILHVTDEAERRKLVLKRARVIMVNPETGKASFCPDFAPVRVCKLSEI
jgi:hypothetical protein